MDLIHQFLENRKQDILDIAKALETEDFATIRHLGHSMKGAGGGYGFNAITDIGAALEKSAKNHKDEEAIRRNTDPLSSYLQHVDIVYE